MEKLTLYPWQAADVKRIVAELPTVGGALLPWALGSGKTVASLEILRGLDAKRALIIAPLSTHDSWVATAKRQGLPEVRIANRKNKAGRAALADLEMGWDGWYVVGPTFMTRSDVSMWGVDAIIADEVHQYVEKTSKGLKNLLKIESTYRIALSGTPARNKVENLWGVNRFLYPHLDRITEVADKNFYSWAAYRLDTKIVFTSQRDQFGNPKTVKEYTGEKELGKTFRDMPLVIPHYARERCCDAHPNGVLADLHEAVEVHETIDLLPDQKRAIKDMETTLVTFIEDNPMVADIPLVAQQRIRQCILGVPTVEWTEKNGEEEQTVSFADDCKSPFIDRLIEILNDDDEPFVVWTPSAKFARVVVRRLNKAGITADEYSGSRKADIGRFGKDFRVLVAIPSAAGTGTDGLQRVSNSEVWLDRDLDETTNEQAVGRLFRTGQTGQVRRWIFHDDQGLSQGRFSDAVEKRLELNRSLRLDSATETT